MCGISLIINKQSKKSQDLSREIREMTSLIAHRGPDGEGFLVDENLGLALGHRRLAILDLSADGKQPMQKDHLTITYNGEIYNYIELREELSHLGHQFKTKTDTEVILAAYIQWGEECFTKMNGMWGLVIYDSKENEIVVCRDRFGVKPVYYYQDDQRILIGSEIRQILYFIDQPTANLKLAKEYLVTGLLDSSEETFFNAIKKLQPSHLMTISLSVKKISIKKYYEIPQAAQKSNPMDFRDLMQSAVALRLRSDVKVGTCLSGGMDSSVISAVASPEYAEQSKKRFQAIHARSLEPSSDESGFAKQVANSSQLDFFEIAPTAEDFILAMDEVIETQEEPFGSPSIFLQYFVMKKAKEIGCKVMLDGQGGDEVLLGYEKYYPVYLREVLLQSGILALVRNVRMALANNSNIHLKSLIKYVIGVFVPFARIFGSMAKARIFRPSLLFGSYQSVRAFSKSARSLFDVQRQDITSTNLPSLLRYEDKNSMRHSIETRLPFLDYRMVEFGLNLDREQKIHNGWSKFILRNTFQDKLPDDVVWRKDKIGFKAPDNIWLKALAPKFAKTVSESKLIEQFCYPSVCQLSPKNAQFYWRVYNLARWEKIFHVSMPHASE